MTRCAAENERPQRFRRAGDGEIESEEGDKRENGLSWLEGAAAGVFCLSCISVVVGSASW